MTHKNIQMVQSIDFDRLDMLVSLRIRALKLYAQNIDMMTEGTAEGNDIHDGICRDLIMPSVFLLAQFLEAVKLDEVKP